MKKFVDGWLAGWLAGWLGGWFLLRLRISRADQFLFVCKYSLQLYLPLFASKETESDSIKTSLVPLYRETDCTRLEETIALKVGGMKTWDVLEEQNVPPLLVKAVSFAYE